MARKNILIDNVEVNMMVVVTVVKIGVDIIIDYQNRPYQLSERNDFPNDSRDHHCLLSYIPVSNSRIIAILFIIGDKK